MGEMNVITAVPTTPTRNSNNSNTAADSYNDFLNIATNPTNNDDFIDNAPVANQMLSSITTKSPTRKSNNKQQPSKMAVETYHGETRPTFDELQSIERHRREILLRVSFLFMYITDIVLQ